MKSTLRLSGLVSVLLGVLFILPSVTLANTNVSPINSSPVTWTYTGINGPAYGKVSTGDQTGNLGDCSATFQVNQGGAASPFDLNAFMFGQPAGLYTLELGAGYTIFACSGYGIRHDALTGAGSGDEYGTFTWNGTMVVPTGDGNTTTHVIRVNSPSLYATTTSPITINFDYYQNEVGINAYQLDFQNVKSFASRTVYGYLDSPFTGSGTYSQSTTTSLVGDGTWKLTVSLVSFGNTEFTPPATLYGFPYQTWFGLNVNDAVQTVTFDASNFSTASSSCAISFSGGFSLSDCFAYIFLPSQTLFASYQVLPSQFSSKFPFSYIASIVSTWNGLVASTTDASPAYTLNYSSLNLGSTTPGYALGNFIPNITAFSSTTVERYFPSGTFDLLKSLVAAILILGLFADIFFEIKHLIKT